jgi:protein TonB
MKSTRILIMAMFAVFSCINVSLAQNTTREDTTRIVFDPVQWPPDITVDSTAINVLESDTTIFDLVQDDPVFPGGEESMKKFVKMSIKYPVEAIENGDQGTVYVRFVIEKDGRVTKASIVRSVAPSLDNEALRIVKTMPIWTPAKHRGVIVRKSVVIPIQFRLN